MICPHCNKIIAEGSETCPFCKAQLTAAPAPVQGAAVPGAAQAPMPQMPYYAPQPLTPQQKYQNLGGFLQFVVVVWKYILPIFTAFYLLTATVSVVSRFFKLDSISWEGLKPILHSEVTPLLLVANAVLYCVVATKIEKRKASFLALWQISGIVLVALSLVSTLVFSGALHAVLSVGIRVSIFLTWNLYFTKSLRVRIYMGSDAYLRASLFNKKTLSPAPERSKSERTKLILLVVALFLVYCVLQGVNYYFIVKENPSLFSVSFQSREETNYTDETAGVSFTIPKGLKENKDLETEEIPLVLESAHSNFEAVSYLSDDVLEGVSEEEKKYINRKQINNAAFIRQEIQEQVVKDFAASGNVSDIKTTVERLGGYEYYVVSLKQTDNDGNTAECINYVHYYNGYQIVFHYETFFTQTSLDSVKEMISTVTIEGEAPLPAQKQ